MELKVGMYVRTKFCGIQKFVNDDKEHYYFGKTKKDISLCCLKTEFQRFLIDWSNDIIDLIEVGDVISFKEDIDNYKKTYVLGIADMILLDEIKDKISTDNIRLIGIVTKEQFEEMEYKVC